MPSRCLQDLRQDNLGRLRPARRPGRAQRPQRAALPAFVARLPLGAETVRQAPDELLDLGRDDLWMCLARR